LEPIRVDKNVEIGSHGYWYSKRCVKCACIRNATGAPYRRKMNIQANLSAKSFPGCLVNCSITICFEHDHRLSKYPIKNRLGTNGRFGQRTREGFWCYTMRSKIAAQSRQSYDLHSCRRLYDASQYMTTVRCN